MDMAEHTTALGSSGGLRSSGPADDMLHMDAAPGHGHGGEHAMFDCAGNPSGHGAGTFA